jgi:predicted GIY-YIG superfamily endonuclease
MDMQPKRRRWTKENLEQTVARCRYKKDFYKKYKGGYNAALSYGKDYYEKLFATMQSQPNPFRDNIHLVYGYFFSDGCLYIGSTMNEKARIENHKKRGTVFNKINTGTSFVYVKLEENVPFDNILKREQWCIDLYKSYNYTLLNKTYASSRGALERKWSKTRIIGEARKYTSFSEWRRESRSSYNAACSSKILGTFKNYYKMSNRSISQQDIINDAQKYRTRIEWRRNSKNIHDIAQRRKIMDLCCNHMQKLHTVWTDTMLIRDAAKYTCVEDWKKISKAAYSAASRKKILHLCRSTFVSGRKFRSDMEIISGASKHSSVSSWKKEDASGYTIARNRNILDKCKNVFI